MEGFAHQGYVGCPYYVSDLGTEHSVELGKQVYKGTRQWLDPNHPYCLEFMNCHFNGKIEDRDCLREVTVGEQMQWALEYKAWKAANNRTDGQGDPSK